MSASVADATSIARPYVAAIFAQAKTAKKEAVVTEEIETIAHAIAEHKELRQALTSPLVSRESKALVLADLAAKGDSITKQALQVLADGGRAEILPQLAVLLRAELNADRGVIVADVTSARPLSDAVKTQLTSALGSATGKTVELALHENPALLGGIAVQLGSLRLDATLAGALNTMRAQLRAGATNE